MNTPETSDPSALLPWYANGTLSAEEKTIVERWLAESPEALQQLRVWQAVQQHVKQEKLPDAGVEMGWRRLKAQLKHERPASRTSGWRMALAASVLLVVGLQTTILMQRSQEPGHLKPLSGTNSGTQADAWRVQVRFVGATSIDDLNNLLGRFDARVVNGPSALGIYEISVPHSATFADQATLLAALRREPLLLQVSAAP